MKVPRILLAAGASGSGKTLITCGILQALINRGLKPCSFKCGPDYIDPMFHSKVIGAKSRNLDDNKTIWDDNRKRQFHGNTSLSIKLSFLQKFTFLNSGLVLATLLL